MKNVFFSIVSVIAVVIGVAGLVTIVIGVRRFLRGLASARWPKTSATVLSSRVVEEEVQASSDEDRGPAPNVFKADVAYEYSVAGRTFKGSRIRFDDVQTSDRARAEAEVARFKVGQPVEVSYDPANHEESVVFPGVSGASAIVPAAGVGALVVAGGMWAIVRMLAGR